MYDRLYLVVFSCLTTLALSQPQCPASDCKMDCEYGREKDVNGCEICSCADILCQEISCARGKVCKVYNKEVEGVIEDSWAICVDPNVPEMCWDPLDPGRCTARLTRWYYDNDQGDCMQFNYGGCAGNMNRFDTRQRCMSTCSPVRGSRSDCGELRCSMLCRNGYLKDKHGCDVCQCANLNDHLGDNNREFSVGVGCEGDGEAFCDLQCPHGYQIDRNGCMLCACMQSTDCPQLTNCEQYCPNGMRLDHLGCELCECRMDGECPDLRCPNSCPYGRYVDEDGCERCMCLNDPCTLIDCPARTICKPYNTSSTRYTAHCLTETSYNNPGCPEKQCKMRCEHGFKTDRRGCDICECRQNYTECPYPRCEACEFGYAFTEDGCKTCTCLADPCLATICKSDEACVSVRYMESKHYTPYPLCVETGDVRRMRVNMEYNYESEEAINHQAVKAELRKQLSELMEVEEEHIADMDVTYNVGESDTSGTIEVNYHIVKKGSTNLVELYKSYRDKLLRKEPSYHSVTVDGVQFVPRTESLRASYSKSADLPSSEASTSGEDGTAAIVIGCVIAVILGVILIAMIVIMVKNRMSKEEEPPRKNIIYTKTETSQSV